MQNTSMLMTGFLSGYFLTKLCKPYIIIQTHQESMLPTISEGNLFIGIDANNPKCKIRKKDIVVFSTPKPIQGNELAVKRIIYFPFEKISYFSKKYRENIELTVPENHFWLLGDNANVSIDSRNYGPVPFEKIKYKLLYRFWPIWSAGFMYEDIPEFNKTN